MEIVFGDLSLGIVKDDVRLILSYNHGSLESFSKDGLEYLQRAVRPAFWRATSDNDRGNGFSKRSCLWMGADLFHTVDGFWADIDGMHLDREDLIAPANNSLLDSPLRQAKEACLTFRLHTATDPSATLLVTWRAQEGEEGLSCHFRYEGVEGLPELPVCGLRLLLPFTVDRFEWDGLSGEVYPDRIWGAKEGHWVHEGIEECPYVKCQEYGMHMGVRRLDITAGQRRLGITAPSSPISFSLLPATPQELEMAWHPIDLPLYRRSVLTLAAAVRGVGGIDSWGSDVGKAFHIPSDGVYEMDFTMI